MDVGTVLYAREKGVHLILSNRGIVRAKWQFMPLPGVMFGDAADTVPRPAPRWASINPAQVNCYFPSNMDVCSSMDGQLCS